MAFRGVDYFYVDSLFRAEELLVRQTARRFAGERILPLIRECYREARFPSELIPEMAELGFLGANLEGYGCAGMSNVEYGLVMPELERADSGVRGHGPLRNGAGLCARTETVRRAAHRVASARAGKAGLDDHRDHQSAIAGGARRTAEGPGKDRAGADFHAQAEQCGDGARMRAAEPGFAGS